MSNRMLASYSVYIAAALYGHLAYLIGFEPAFGYPPWLRMRISLRFLALAGGSLRMLAVGEFDCSRLSDKLGTGLSGCVCALLGLLSLPIKTVAHLSMSAHQHELVSVSFVSVGYYTHWIIGLCFCFAFIFYTFPILVILPSSITFIHLIYRIYLR